ncbi:hypothetical protein ACFLS1_12925 [Verrucomicrobiota bacterium]
MKKKKHSTPRIVSIILATVALLSALAVCSQMHRLQNIMQFVLFAPVAILAPLVANLAFRSRILSFFAGPLCITLAVLIAYSYNGPEAICWFPLAAPMMVLYTAPAWFLSWMITDGFRKNMPDKSGEQQIQPY